MIDFTQILIASLAIALAWLPMYEFLEDTFSNILWFYHNKPFACGQCLLIWSVAVIGLVTGILATILTGELQMMILFRTMIIAIVSGGIYKAITRVL
jgi:hypothetical protein